MRDEDYLNRLRAISNQQNVPLRVKPAEAPQIPQQYAPTFNKPFIAFTPQPTKQQPTTPTVGPKYSSPFAAFKDVVFDANTAQDIAKRQAAGQAASYRQQQLDKGNTRPDQNFLQAAFREPLTLGATQGALARIGTVEFPRFLAAKVTGNKAAEKAVMERVGRITSGEDKRFQVLGVPSAFGQKDLGEKQDLGQAAKRGVGAVLGTAGFAIGGGAVPSLLKIGGKEGLKTLAKVALAESTAGGLGNVGAVLTRNPDASAKELFTAGAIGFGIGAPAAVFGGALSAGINKAITTRTGRLFINRLAEETDSAAIRDAIKEIAPNLADNQLTGLSREIAQATTPEEVQTILTRLASQETTAATRQATTQTAQKATRAATQAIDATARELAKTTDTTAVKVAIDALFPNLDNTTRATFADTIAKSNDTATIKNALQQAEERSQALSASIKQLTPEAPSQIQRQAAEAAQLVETPPVLTAPVRPVTESPTVTPTPSTVQNAISPSTVQDAVGPQGIAPQVGKTDRLYHGTTNKQAIEKNGFVASKYGSQGDGVYFTNNPEQAKQISGVTQGSGKTEVVEASLAPDTKLYEVKAPTTNVRPNSLQDRSNIPFDQEIHYLFTSTNADPMKAAKMLREAGYDGVRIGNDTVVYNTDKIVSTPPVAQVGKTPTPAGVQGAVEGLPERLVAAAEAQQQRYAPATRRQQIAEVWDPRSAALKIDRRFAKEIADVKIGDLYAIDRLEFYLMQSQQYGLQAQEWLAKSNIAKVVQKYKPDTAAGDAFNTYRIFMRDLEQIADGRPAIVRDVSPEDKLAFVRQFEGNNPTARNDLQAMVKDIEALQDTTTQGPDAFLAKSQLDAARTKKDGSKYQFFTPVKRAMPDEVERAMVNSRNIGSLGEQRVLRDFTSSDIPVDPTYNSVTDYVATIYKQLGQSKVIKKFKERVEQGVVEGAEFIQTPEDFIKTERLRERFKELKTISVELKKEIKKTTGKARVAREQVKTEIAKLKTADVRQTLNLKAATKASQQKVTVAMNRAKELLTDSLDVADVDARAAVGSLTDDELLDLLNYMTRGELFAPAPVGRAKFKTAQTAQGKAAQAAETTKSQQAAVERIAKKGDNFSRLVDQVSDMRMDQEVVDNARRGIRQELIDLRTDPITGLQIVAGRDINGIPFKIEVRPEYARLLQGIGQENINEALRLASLVQKPFRQGYTGVLNPAFQVAQATWNAVLTPLLSKDGIRVYSPSAVREAVKSFNSNSRFQQLLRANGAPAFGGGYFQLPADTTAQALAAQADNLSKLKWFANPKRAWSKLESLGGKLDNASRTSAAEAAYQRVLRQTNNKEAALAEAIFARTQVLPDYSNLHNVIRSADSVLMYTGAAQAGTRTFLRALRERPGQTLGRMGIFASTAAAITAYNMAQDNGEAFYKDMVDSGKGYILDNNVIIVLSGAKKDEKTGEWSRIIKYGIPNELRPLNKAIRSTIYDGQPGIPVKQYAMSLFDFFTGNIKDSNNPAIDIANAIRTGKDPRTGREIYDQTMNNDEKRDAILKYAQRQFGLPGKLTASDKKAETFINSFVDRVYGAKGSTEGSRYYQNQDKAIKKVDINRTELDAYFGTVAPRSKDLTGNEIKDKTYYDSASKATTYLRYPKTFEVSKEIDRLAREQGKTGDPLFDLPADQLRVVLNLQANYSPGNFEDQAIRNLNPWLNDFNNKRSEYFDKILSEEKKKAGNVDPMGIAIPKATPELSSKLDKLKTLSVAERSQYYADNPEITEFFAKQDDYERTKREFMGLPQFDKYPQATQQVQGYIDEYNKLPKGNGPLKKDGTPSSPNRSAWIQANPDKWAAMSNQWTLQDIYKLQKEGALAVYEGIDFTEEGIKALTDIAKSLGLGQGGGFGDGTSPEYKAAMAALQQSGITVKPLSIVSAAPRRIKLKRVKVPTSRRTARIRLR